MRSIRWAKYALLPAALVLSTLGVQAQATRTWVSGVGDDANPCSRTAPCKTYAGAISKTAAGGIIDALDPGGYGTLTITKAITVEGTGTLASTLNSGGINGFVINIPPGANRHVVLRNLSIDGPGTALGLNGIRFISGDSLTLENVTMYTFSGHGIDFAPNSLARLTVRNCVIGQARGATSFGINILPVVGGTARVSIENSTIANNTNGIRVQDSSNVTIFHSNISNNASDGIFANSVTAAGLVVTVEASEVTHNSGNGLRTAGGASFMRVANTLIAGNGTGVSAPAGQLCTFLSNRLTGNTAAGAFTGTCVPADS